MTCTFIPAYHTQNQHHHRSTNVLHFIKMRMPWSYIQLSLVKECEQNWMVVLFFFFFWPGTFSFQESISSFSKKSHLGTTKSARIYMVWLSARIYMVWLSASCKCRLKLLSLTLFLPHTFLGRNDRCKNLLSKAWTSDIIIFLKGKYHNLCDYLGKELYAQKYNQIKNIISLAFSKTYT